MKYDYLIVGSGLFGSVFAYEATKKNKKCLVIDKRDHIGGNIYSENIENINVHKYGPHIFHTNNKEIWEYMSQFTEFNNFIMSPIANYKNEIYNLPFNMNTFSKMWNISTPQEAIEKIEEQKSQLKIINPKNLEEQALITVGRDIYEKLIKGYVEKQWGRKPIDLPAFIIKRLPVRFIYDNNYYNDKYQGIPIGGYTKIIEKMLEKSDVKLNFDYFSNKKQLKNTAQKIIFTGMIDEFYNYKFGNLEYRSLKFETETLNVSNYQGNSMVSYTDREIPYTRIIEHKHFEFGVQDKTIITKEYSIEWNKGDEPYYPINNEKNNEMYEKYKKISQKEKNIIFGGRLAEYKYYDMDKVVQSALELIKKELK